ncbi:MAG: AraC family transcriptional regulator [Flavobacteriia bacterium]|nr:MAG: AraC family transcriptional regulator [Flavobacteriia bacterium]
MNQVNITSFTVIGIAVKTTNANGKSAKDIGALWHQFMSENILDKIPNKTDDTIYAIYTDYEGDYTQPYTTILGCRVENAAVVPEGMLSKTIKGGNYAGFTAKGDLTRGAVYKTWAEIWQTGLDRLYATDFEVYGVKAQNPKAAEVEIFVGVKE